MPANCWIWMGFNCSVTRSCCSNLLSVQPEQVTCILTFIISSSSARVRRGIIRELEDVLREAFTPSMCSLTLSCCFCRKEKQRRGEEKVALEKASHRVVNVNSLSLYPDRRGSHLGPTTYLIVVWLWGILPSECSVFSFATWREQKEAPWSFETCGCDYYLKSHYFRVNTWLFMNIKWNYEYRIKSKLSICNNRKMNEFKKCFSCANLGHK